MSRARAIEDHYLNAWGAPGIPVPFPFGGHESLPEDFVVLKYPPSPGRGMWTFATRCMSQPGDETPVELHMFSLVDVPPMIELLNATAYYHRLVAPLDHGHSLFFGRPWLPGSRCDHGLVSLPYLDGPKLEIMDRDGVRARCYWLIPVTASEVEFGKREGLDALEQRFEQARFAYQDPARPAVA